MGRGRTASGIDTAWLQRERPDNSVVVHGILWCDGEVDLELLRARVAERWIPHYPGLRQRPEWSDNGLGPVTWVDVEPDLTHHVRSEPLDAPGDDTALDRAVGAAMSRALPTDRPWWAMTVLAGYRAGTAILVAVHHGLADGVALNHLFHALADHPPSTADGTPVAYAAPPTRLPGQGDVRVLGRGTRDRARSLGGQLRAAVRGRAQELRATSSAVAAATASLVRPTRDAPTLLQARLGREKAARWTSTIDLETVRKVGRRDGGSVNDVLCAVVAGALREYLIAAGTPADAVPGLHAVVPTNLRPLDHAISERLGNEVGLVLPALPTDEPDPARRVATMHRTMAAIKRTDEALVTFAGIAGAGHARSRFTQGLVRRYASTSSVVITNVPGPVAPLTLAGSRVSDLLFWVPCTGRLALGVSILSYAGRVRLGVAGDLAVLGGHDGVDAFTRALDEGLHAL